MPDGGEVREPNCPSELGNLLFYMEKRGLSKGYAVYDGPYDRLEFGPRSVHLLPLSTFLASELAF